MTPFSLFSRQFPLMKWLASKGGKTANIGRHCQRTSNHNFRAVVAGITGLVAIVKEHQITTLGQPRRGQQGLVAIVKEHQITTGLGVGVCNVILVAIVKEHQITTGRCGATTRRGLVAIVKEHQITTSSTA